MAEGFKFRARCGMDCTANPGACAKILVGGIDNCIAIHLFDDIAKPDANSDWLPFHFAFNHSSIPFQSQIPQAQHLR
jgi:hypothetical protein